MTRLQLKEERRSYYFVAKSKRKTSKFYSYITEKMGKKFGLQKASLGNQTFMIKAEFHFEHHHTQIQTLLSLLRSPFACANPPRMFKASLRIFGTHLILLRSKQ